MKRQPQLIGQSAAMRTLRATIARFASRDVAVLIEGETGTGKELVASALHEQSGRRGAYVPFNVCAIPDAMFEATLFGHVRGAFTGAIENTHGLLVEANGGTAFFDEIGSLSLANQGKLLRAIETGAFRPIGAGADRISTFRTISATNEPLDDLTRNGRFREDLAYRLNGVTIHVPPLRERMDDIDELLDSFARTAIGTPVCFSDAARRQILDHSWPGNVRELRQFVQRIIAYSDSDVANEQTVAACLVRPRTATDDRRAAAMPSEEASSLLGILEDCKFDTALAAEMLGIHRSTLYRRMQQFGVRIRSRAMRTIRANSRAIRADVADNAVRPRR